jgi:YVTN family beta-propeller protein
MEAIFRQLTVTGAIALVLTSAPACVTASVSGNPASDPLARGAVERPADGPYVYVANQGAATVTVIDAGDGSIVAVIRLEELGFGPNARPHHVAVEPDGSFWYVSLIGENRVLKFDRDNRLVSSLEFERPGMLAVHPTEDLLVVGRSMAAVNPPQRIGMVRRSTMEVEEIDVFVPRPHSMAVSSDGRWVFTSSLAENTIVAVDIESGEAELTRLGGEEPHVFVQFALSPDGSTLVATAQISGKLLVFDVSDAPEVRLVREIEVNPEPWHPAYSPDGRFVYFGNLGANTVTVVDAESWSVARVISGEGLSEPHGIALTPDGGRLFVSNRNVKGAYEATEALGFDEPNGTIAVIDPATGRILNIIEVAPYAAGLGVAAPR